MAETAFMIAASFFTIYGLLAAVEVGIAIRVLLNKQTPAKQLFTPLWEVTNVFLVFGFTIIGFVFSSAVSKLSSALLSTLLFALCALLLRASTVLTVFYLAPRRANRSLASLMLGLNLTIPLSFTAAGIYLLTGLNFWRTSYGLALFITAAFGLVSTGLLMADKYNRGQPGRLSRQLFTTWALLIGAILPISLTHTFDSSPTWQIVSFIVIGVLSLVFEMVVKLRRWLWLWASGVSLVLPLILAWSNRRYLIRSQVDLAEAFSGSAYGRTFLIGALIMLPIIAIGIWLFAKLLSSPNISD